MKIKLSAVATALILVATDAVARGYGANYSKGGAIAGVVIIICGAFYIWWVFRAGRAHTKEILRRRKTKNRSSP